MKVIFITTIRFAKQHFIDLYVESVSKKFDVEMWDLSNIFNRNDDTSHGIENRKMVNSLSELDLYLGEIEDKKVIITDTLFYSLKRIYKTIKKHNVDIVNITKEGLCSNLFERSKLSIKFKYGISDAIKILVKRNDVLRTIYNKTVNGKVRFDYLLATDNFYPEHANKFVKIHHLKYDEYLDSKDKERPIVEDYIVFLDTAVPNHPMYKYSSRKSLNIDKYMEELNNFFDYVEEKYQKKVVISAHPKSEYSSEAFNGRLIFKYKTGVLIEYSSFVISHYSTSVVNAILAMKPLVFLYSDEMLGTAPKYTAIGGIEFAKKLDAPIVNMEKINDFQLLVNQKKYNEFIDNYIVNQNKKNMRNEEVILEFLQNL